MWDITYTSLLTHPLFFRYPSHPSVEEALYHHPTSPGLSAPALEMDKAPAGQRLPE